MSCSHIHRSPRSGPHSSKKHSWSCTLQYSIRCSPPHLETWKFNRAGRLGSFCIFIGRYSILCRSGNVRDGRETSFLPGLWGSIPGPGRGVRRGSGRPPNLINKFVFIAIQTSATQRVPACGFQGYFGTVRWAFKTRARRLASHTEKHSGQVTHRLRQWGGFTRSWFVFKICGSALVPDSHECCSWCVRSTVRALIQEPLRSGQGP